MSAAEKKRNMIQAHRSRFAVISSKEQGSCVPTVGRSCGLREKRKRQKNTMTIVRFAEMHRVTVKTVQDWIAKGYIPGATETSVPDSARRPYTKTRAKKGEAIIKSILTACDNELGTCAALYSISPASYDAYIQSLLDSGYIIQFEDEGLTYYNITASGADLLRNWNKNKNDVLGAIQAGAAVAGVIVPVIAAMF